MSLPVLFYLCGAIVELSLAQKQSQHVFIQVLCQGVCDS